MSMQAQQIPAGWRVKTFENCILSGNKKLKGLKRREYKDIGAYPIIDQGNSFISGYTDTEDKVYEPKSPLILFGDHTRILKYIDFPFAIGADGTKIFQTRSNIESKFFYYYLLNIKIPNTGYNRHYKYLKDLKILLPPLPEQIRIAQILSKVDEEIEKVEKIIIQTEKLKKGLMQKLLTKGIGHTKFKQTELGEIPEEWEIVTFAQICESVKTKFDPKIENETKYIGLEHIKQETGEVIGHGKSTDTLSIKSTFMPNDILFGKLRPYLRKFCITKLSGVCSTEILVFRAKDNVESKFAFYIVQDNKFSDHSISKSFGTKMPRTDWKIIKEFKLRLPNLIEQKQIIKILTGLDNKITTNRTIKSKLFKLKKALMSDLLSGKVRAI